MKATLEFDLPEEQEIYLQAVRSGEICSAILDVVEQLRSWQKYGHSFKTADEVIESVQNLLYQEVLFLIEFN